jgi:triosephosphate isomerase
MARRPLIAGNWKMHKTHLEAIQLTQKLAFSLEPEDTEAVEVVVCPPFTALRSVQTLIEGDRYPIRLGAQDCHQDPKGAFTGEVSAPMLAALRVAYVIVGHSERRQYYGETDTLVAAKARAAQVAGMTPIVCVGETLEQRETGITAEIVNEQLRGSLAGVAGPDKPLVVAYEPIWAIGTGRTATPADAQETIAMVRQTVRELAGKAIADELRILYGGSVKVENITDLMAEPDIDGGLVGGASLDGEGFARIIQRTAEQTRARR